MNKSLDGMVPEEKNVARDASTATSKPQGSPGLDQTLHEMIKIAKGMADVPSKSPDEGSAKAPAGAKEAYTASLAILKSPGAGTFDLSLGTEGAATRDV